MTSNTTKSIKVIHLVPFLSFGGAEKVASMIAQKRQDIQEKILMCYTKQTYTTSVPVNSLNIEKYTSYDIFYKQYGILKKMKKLFIVILIGIKLFLYFKKEQPDIIVVHSEVIRRSLIICKILWKLTLKITPSPKVVCVLHSATLITNLFRQQFPNSYYISPSAGTKIYYEQKYPELKKRITIIPNPVNIYKDETSKETTLEPHIKKLLNNPKIIKIISVGRLSKEKGQWHFIRGLWYLKNKKKLNVHGIIIGANAGLKNNLEKLITSLNMQNYIHLLGHKNNPYPYMRKSTLLWFTSIQETFGLVLIEAMMLKLPVVATDIHYGPREILNYSKDYKRLLRNKFIITDYGILTPKMEDSFLTNEPLTKKELININAILKLLADTQLKNKLKNQAFNYSSNIYEPKHIIKQYHTFYRRILRQIKT